MHAKNEPISQLAHAPWADAFAVWQMADARDEVGRLPLTLHGAVELGVPMEGAAYEASLRRGGNGRVARFDGGYLMAGRAGDPPLALTGDTMTLCLRLCDLEGRWDAPLLSRYAPDDRLTDLLYSAPFDARFISYAAAQRAVAVSPQALTFLWRTEPLAQRVRPDFLDCAWFRHLYQISGEDFTDGVLRVGVPVGLIGPQGWHDVVVRFRRANLELFVDGVRVDEEWPHGALYHFRSPFLIGAALENGVMRAGFHGLIDHLALWQRALSDDEIVALSGGPTEVARRETEILGEERPGLQYERPRGHNTFVGDCMPFYEDGRFHLYYLYDRRRHTSKWGMGAHQFAHASSSDLVHWEHHPLALPITEPWECSLGTGTIVHHRDTYHAYYIHHGKRGYFRDAPYERETILDARSSDGIYFTKDPRPVVPIDYRQMEDVNPDIFPMASGQGFYLSISGWKIFESPDLLTWEESQALTCPRDLPRGICCSHFVWNGWTYWMWDNGRYRVGAEPIAPGWRWVEPSHPATSEGLSVPKVAGFTGNRYLLVGFLGGTGYAGEAVFRELVQYSDGTLGTRFVPEMIPASGAPLALPFAALRGEAERMEDAIQLQAKDGLALGMLAGLPQDVRITLTVVPEPGTRCLGLCVRGEGDYARGAELRIEPGAGRVQYGTPQDGKLALTSPNRYGTDFGIEGVPGLERPFSLDLIVKNDFVDACIAGQRTLISRRPDRPQGDRLFLFCEQGAVCFEALQVRPLLP